jgi:hypothetical protein
MTRTSALQSQRRARRAPLGVLLVAAGCVRRGSAIAELRGTAAFGDFGSGRIWGLKEDPPGTWSRTQFLDTSLSISSFGQDAAGEIYVVDYSGAIYRLREGP